MSAYLTIVFLQSRMLAFSKTLFTSITVQTRIANSLHYHRSQLFIIQSSADIGPFRPFLFSIERKKKHKSVILNQLRVEIETGCICYIKTTAFPLCSPQETIENLFQCTWYMQLRKL